MKKLACLVLTLLLGVSFIHADTRAYDDGKYKLNYNKPKHSDSKNTFFQVNETTFDIFGLYALTTESGLYDDGFGGGLGVNHFFTENLGAGVSGYWWDGDPADDVISSVDASLIYRLPLGDSRLAPYGFGGIGGNFSSIDQVNFHLGAGAEYRFTSQMGVFADARYVLADRTNDYALIRTGIRFNF